MEIFTAAGCATSQTIIGETREPDAPASAPGGTPRTRYQRPTNSAARKIVRSHPAAPMKTPAVTSDRGRSLRSLRKSAAER